MLYFTHHMDMQMPHLDMQLQEIRHVLAHTFSYMAVGGLYFENLPRDMQIKSVAEPGIGQGIPNPNINH